ncbi:hypothetical protein [Alysiella crassa]|uniref:hypothetical protein n=1 Tax=Alysiella crassa TaxID=153491 RepID=UPI001FD562B0|nr:hypothetical protein [Alysiella crassa]UOP05777.1 hypothetical protein LVJ80_07645 [Alysiella crassa]UOP08104.1 hypothetical protein LVJ80_07325 [Alysiella crassa]
MAKFNSGSLKTYLVVFRLPFYCQRFFHHKLIHYFIIIFSGSLKIIIIHIVII